MGRINTTINCPYCEATIEAEDACEVLRDAIMLKEDDSGIETIDCWCCHKSMKIDFDIEIEVDVMVTVEKTLTHIDVRYQEWVANGKPEL